MALQVHIAELARGLNLAGKRIESRQITAIRALAIEGADVARRIASAYSPPAVATGAYMRGWRAYHHARSSTVGNSKAYSVYVESGRRAGARMPPIAAIRKWLRAKQGNPKHAYAVARKIARDGVAPRPVLPQLTRWVIAGLTVRMPAQVKAGMIEGFKSAKRGSSDRPIGGTMGGFKAGGGGGGTANMITQAGIRAANEMGGDE